jgi:hypothetical protein
MRGEKESRVESRSRQRIHNGFSREFYAIFLALAFLEFSDYKASKSRSSSRCGRSDLLRDDDALWV